MQMKFIFHGEGLVDGLKGGCNFFKFSSQEPAVAISYTICCAVL